MSIGGSVSFGSLGLKTYVENANIRIISNCGKQNFDPSLLKNIKKKKIDLQGVKWSNTNNTNFIIEYFNHSRELTLKSRSPNLNFEDIPQIYLNNPPDVIILAPLCQEISLDYVNSILKQFPHATIGVDLQGFIRKIDNSGKITYILDNEIINNIRKIIDLIGDRLILKGSEIEMKLLAGGSENLIEVMEKFDNYDLKGIYIMTLGEAGSMLISHGEKLLKIPAFRPKGVKDETGAGDVYLAIFLYEYINSDKTWKAVEKAAILASAAASFLVEEIGPVGFKSINKVKKRVKRKNYISEGVV